MKFNLRVETNKSGIAKLRLSFFVKREHEKKARRVREWCESKKATRERIETLQGILRKRGMAGLAESILGKSRRTAFNTPDAPGAAINQFIEAKRAAELEDRSLGELEYKLGVLATRFFQLVDARGVAGYHLPPFQ